jgi:type II secretory pathway predicted ATPase ExeA
VHREALDYLRYGLETHAGFVVITGEIGSGKTTLLQTLLRGLDSQTSVGRIVNTLLEPRELIETIMIDFGLDPGGRSKPLMLRDLAQYLVDQRLAGRLVLLVIDEAQNLSQGALEELRMLSNLETEKSKLMQIVLVGQPNLRDKLAASELEQLRQRITVSYHLQPLDAPETFNYINHRLRRAALGVPLEFPREATDLVHWRSRGIPRIINVICDAALVFGYAEERRQMDLPLMREVLAELESTGVLPPEAGTVRPAIGAPASRPDADRPPEPAPAGAAVVGAAAPPSPTPYDQERRHAEASARAAMDQAARRAADMDRREAALRQRERELAEQRRVLAEEYRLLRMQRSTLAPSAGAPARQHAHARPAPEPFIASRPGIWAWVRRVATGGPHRAVEGH